MVISDRYQRTKIYTAPIEYFWAWGTLIHEKNLSSKISCQTPFKLIFSIVFKTLFTYEKNKVNEGLGGDESHDKGEAYDDGVGNGSHVRG